MLISDVNAFCLPLSLFLSGLYTSTGLSFNVMVQKANNKIIALLV